MRIALGVEYCGTHYQGWQWQSSGRTVQQTLEDALALVAKTPISTLCAGRTDAGVHAREQVVHFDTEVVRSEKAWTMGANTTLPHSIRVLWAKQVSDDFHARRSAIARSYQYIINNRSVRPAIEYHQHTWHYSKLDAELMHQAAQHFLGEQDFTSFRAAGCQSHTPMRNVHKVSVHREGDLVIVNITANAFLHHMVRNIVGALFQVGEGRQLPEWIRQVLDQKDRRLSGVTAPPNGLYLMKVEYPRDIITV